MQIVLDSTKGEWQYIPRVAALPQLDRGSDYESERHRFESCTPHQSNLKPGSFERPGFFLMSWASIGGYRTKSVSDIGDL